MEEPSGRVTLNVGGLHYRICRAALAAFPGTKLGGLVEPEAAARFAYDARAGEFFFDRSGRLFEQVLHLCLSGHLHRPAACRAALRAELAFWGLAETRLPACCWSKLCPDDHEEEAEQEEAGEPGRREDRRGLLERGFRGRGGRWATTAWALLEEPRSSPWATGYAVMSLLFNVALIAILCAKGGQREDHFKYFVDDDYTHTPHSSVEWVCPQIPSLLHLELFFILCFMCEFAFRLVCCPDKKRFFRKPLNVVDFLAFFPVCLDLFFSGRGHQPKVLPCWLNLFRVVYIIKLLKIFKLLETPLMLRVFPYMFKSILKETAILMWVFLFEILLFGTLILFADLIEEHAATPLDDIFSTLWWAVITLTTIGYGDIYPIQTASKVVAAFALLSGLLTIIIPIPIFFIKFKHHYTSALIKEKKRREEKARPTVTSSAV